MATYNATQVQRVHDITFVGIYDNAPLRHEAIVTLDDKTTRSFTLIPPLLNRDGQPEFDLSGRMVRWKENLDKQQIWVEVFDYTYNRIQQSFDTFLFSSVPFVAVHSTGDHFFDKKLMGQYVLHHRREEADPDALRDQIAFRVALAERSGQLLLADEDWHYNLDLVENIARQRLRLKQLYKLKDTADIASVKPYEVPFLNPIQLQVFPTERANELSTGQIATLDSKKRDDVLKNLQFLDIAAHWNR